MSVQVKAKASCKYDILSLGEVMLRLDPGAERIHTTRHFRAWEGGGEYNVARGLKRCFGQRAAVVTGIVDNPIGRLLEDLIFQGGVDMEYVKWFDYDGIGRKVRVGLNFTEAGYGVRAAVGCSDRANSAASQLKAGDIDWNKIFAEDGVRWIIQCMELYPEKSGYGRFGVLTERFCPSDGLLDERYDDGTPSSIWFTYNGWAAAAALEGILDWLDMEGEEDA